MNSVRALLVSLLLAGPADAAFAQHPGWRGEVISRHDLTVSAEVSGRLVTVRELGSRVAAGDLLAQLDERDLALSLRQALNALELARLETSRMQERMTRATTLVERNLYARVELRELQLDLDAARVREHAAQASVEQAHLVLERSRMRAPVTGAVVDRMRQAGEYVEAGDPVLRVVGSEALEIQLHIPLADAWRLPEGTAVVLEHNEQSVAAQVLRVVPVADPPARQLRVFLNAPDPAWPVGGVVLVRVN